VLLVIGSRNDAGIDLRTQRRQGLRRQEKQLMMQGA
jgi:hypothetical protein